MEGLKRVNLDPKWHRGNEILTGRSASIIVRPYSKIYYWEHPFYECELYDLLSYEDFTKIHQQWKF